MATDDDDLTAMLADGWEIVGYSVCMMALGATSQNILLRLDKQLCSFVIVNKGDKIVGRNIVQLAPMADRRGLVG